MAHILVIGASRGIGLETVRRALEAGHEVRALARSVNTIGLADARLQKVRGDALHVEDVAAALADVTAVIQTLGVGFGELFRPVRLFSAATRVLIDAMTSRGVRRVISVTGFGAGDSEASISPLQRVPFKLVFGRAYHDKGVQEQLLKTSTLEWTIVRPGVLTSARRSGRFLALDQPSKWRNGLIGRADVADFLVTQIDNPAGIHKEYVLVN